MPRGKDFTTTEISEICSYLKDGCTYAEIGELMGRTKKSIQNLVYRNRWTDGRIKTVSTTHEALDMVPETKTPKILVEDHSPVIEKTLRDFTPREIIKYMYELGYRIEDNQLVCIVKQKVNVKVIINEKV